MSFTPISKKEKEKLGKNLFDKNAVLPCARCGENKFIFADGYINMPLQSNLSESYVDSAILTAIAIVCKNCGFINHHVVKVLENNLKN